MLVCTKRFKLLEVALEYEHTSTYTHENNLLVLKQNENFNNVVNLTIHDH